MRDQLGMPRRSRTRYYYYCSNGPVILGVCEGSTYLPLGSNNCFSLWTGGCLGSSAPATKRIQHEAQHVTTPLLPRREKLVHKQQIRHQPARQHSQPAIPVRACTTGSWSNDANGRGLQQSRFPSFQLANTTLDTAMREQRMARVHGLESWAS